MTSSFASSLSFLNMTPNSAPFVRPPVVGSSSNIHHYLAPKQESSIQPQVAPTPQQVQPTYFMQSSCPNYSQINRKEVSSNKLTTANSNTNNTQTISQLQSSFNNQSKSNIPPTQSTTTFAYKNMHASANNAPSFIGAATAHTELKGFTQVLPNTTQSTATRGTLYDKITNKLTANNINNNTNDTMNQIPQRKPLKRSLSTFVGGGGIDTSESSAAATNKISSYSIVNQPAQHLQQQQECKQPLQQNEYLQLPKQPAISGIARSPHRRSTTKESYNNDITSTELPSQTGQSPFADLLSRNQKKPPIVLNPYSIKTIKVLTEIPESNSMLNPTTNEFENHSLSSLQQQLNRLNPRMMSNSLNNNNTTANISAANNSLSNSNQKMPRIQGLARSKSRNLTMTSVGSITLDNINNSQISDSPLKKQQSIELGSKDMILGNTYPMSQSLSVLLKDNFDNSESVRGSVVVRPAKMPSTTFFVDAPTDDDGVVDQQDFKFTSKLPKNQPNQCDSSTIAGIAEKKKEKDEFIQNLFGKLHAIDEEHQKNYEAALAPASEHVPTVNVDPHLRLKILTETKDVKQATSEESTNEFKYTYRQNSKSPSKLGRNTSPIKQGMSAIALVVEAATTASTNLLLNPMNSVIHAKKVPIGSDEGSFGTAIETLYNTPSFVYLKDGNKKSADQSQSPLSSPVVVVRGDSSIAQNSLQQKQQQQQYEYAPTLQLQLEPKKLLRSYSNATTELSTEMDSPDSALTHLSFPSDSANAKATGIQSQQVLSASSSGVSSPNQFVMHILPAGMPVPFLRMAAPKEQQQSSLSVVSKNY